MSEKEQNQENISNEESIKDQVEEILDEAIEEAESKDASGTKESSKGEQPSEKEQLKADLEKEKDKFLRLFAEFENYKRRTSKERVEMFKTANQDVIVSMLPVLDDFDRAMGELKKAKDKELLKGVELISNKFRSTLKSKGLEEIEVKEGDTFDAEIHEAITQIPAPKDKLKGKIVDVVETGYKLGDRIIRFPKVVTGK